MSESDAARTAPERTPMWNTDPLFESQGGPDNAADGVMAAANGLVLLWRKLRATFSRS
jgi:hypothetical protein